MATHPSILAWRIPWTEEPGRLQSMGSKRVGHDYVTKHSKAQHSTAMSNLKMNNRFFISNKRNKIKFNKRCVRFAQWKLQNVEIKKIQMKSALCSWIGRLHILKMVCVCVVLSRFSCVQIFSTLRNVACQAPQSMGFSRQEYWSGLPRPPPGDLPEAGIEPASPALQADSLLTEPPGKPS